MTTYYVVVAARTSTQQTGTQSATEKTFVTVLKPGKVVNLKTSQLTDVSVHLSWDPPLFPPSTPFHYMIDFVRDGSRKERVRKG